MIKPVICDIYSSSNYYNAKKNIVRIQLKFDDTDNRPKVFDVPLISIGVFKNPDFRYHKVLVFLPDDLSKKVSINNPEEVEVGSTDIYLPAGILIDKVQYNKLMGSISNSAFNVDSDVGNQDINDLEFFIPAGFKKKGITEQASPDDIDDTNEICGIGGAKDGSIIIRGPNGEIVLGAQGLRISGPLTLTEGSPNKTDILKENTSLMEIIPKTIVTPFPNRLPAIDSIMSIAGIFTGVSNVVGAIQNMS